MQKAIIAFLLGCFSFLLLMFLGEKLTYNFGDAGLIAMFVVVVAYFFICQFSLSRGNPKAYRKDWPVMLALDGVWLVVLIPMALMERWQVVLVQGLGILVSCCGGTFAGAVAASMAARRRRARR